MPDDKNTVAEQPAAPATEGEFVHDAGFEGGFDDKPENPAAPPAPPAEPKAEGAPEEPKPAEPKLGEPPAPAEPELTDAQKKLAERAKKFTEGEGGPTPPAPVSPPAEPPKPAAEQPPAAGAPSSTVAEILKLPGVAGAKIIVDGAEMTAEKFAEQYPEIVQADDLFGTARVKKALADAGVAEMRDQIANLGLLLQVQQEHPDVRKVVKSKDYQDWIKGQPPGVQKMEESMDPDDAIALLDAFKEHLAKAAGAAKKDEAAKNKQKREDLHKDNLKGVQRPSGSAGPKTDDDEFSEGFNQ